MHNEWNEGGRTVIARRKAVHQEFSVVKAHCVLGLDSPTEDEKRNGRFLEPRKCTYCKRTTPKFCTTKGCWKPVCPPCVCAREEESTACSADANGVVVCRDCRTDFPECSNCAKKLRIVLCRTPGCFRYVCRYGYGCRAAYGYDYSDHGVALCDTCSTKIRAGRMQNVMKFSLGTGTIGTLHGVGR